MKLHDKFLEIEYIDSGMIHEQTDEVAEPEYNRTVGYFVDETDIYITLAAEVIGKDWRRQISIPKCAIRFKQKLTEET